METVAVGREIAPAVAAGEAEARMSLAAGGEPWLTGLEGRGGALGAAGASAPSETGFRTRVMPPLVVIATLATWPSPAGNLKPDQSDSGNSTYSLAGSASRPTR